MKTKTNIIFLKLRAFFNACMSIISIFLYGFVLRYVLTKANIHFVISSIPKLILCLLVLFILFMVIPTGLLIYFFCRLVKLEDTIQQTIEQNKIEQKEKTYLFDIENINKILGILFVIFVLCFLFVGLF